eukprot:2962554-Pleurochrysis_carterae.AAC.1
MKARCGAAKTPLTARVRTVAVRCACHTRRPWRGSGVHGSGGAEAGVLQPSTPGVLASVGCP